MNRTTPPNTTNDSEYPSLISHSAGWIVVIIALLLGIVALATYLPLPATDAPADPFADYADVMPLFHTADQHHLFRFACTRSDGCVPLGDFS